MNKYHTARYYLLFYALKDEKVRERIIKENIDFGVIEEHFPEMIEDLFNVLKQEQIEKEIKELDEKLHKENEPIKQAKILQQIMDLKKIISRRRKNEKI